MSEEELRDMSGEQYIARGGLSTLRLGTVARKTSWVYISKSLQCHTNLLRKCNKRQISQELKH